MSDLNKIFELKKRWDTADGDDFGKEVYSPCLEHAKFYRTQTGFFRLKVLDRWASALVPIVQKKDVKIEILSSPDLDFNVADILDETLSEEDKRNKLAEIGQNGVLAALGLSKDGEEVERRKFRQVLFTYLIASKKIEIKIAMMDSQDLGDDLFHYKRGYFIFNDEKVIAHEGSGNLTKQGLGEQGNFLNLYKSTIESHHEDIAYIRNKVDSHWDEKNKRVKIIPLDKKTLDIIKKSSEKNKKKFYKDLKDRIKKEEEEKNGPEIIIDPPQPEPPVFTIPKWINYREGDWKHQGEAVDEWLENKKGILAMATGSGKTITAMIAANLLYQEKTPLLIVVSAPYGILVDQWCDEIRDFGLEPLNIPSLKSRRDKILAVKDTILTIKHGITDIVIMVTTTNFLKDEKFNSLLSDVEDIHKLLIGDEVHNLGQKGFRSSPPDYFDYRLGLSATPNSRFDTKRDQFLKDFFGEIVYEFGLREAIGKCLVPYDYFVHGVYLNDDEMEHWVECSRSIEMLMAMHDGDLDNSELKAKLRERSKISSVAEGKVHALSRVLDQEDIQEIKHTIIYATDTDPQQLINVKSVLDDKKIAHRQLTQEESRKQRKEIIRLFKDSVFQILTAKRVLDEGVNVPVIKCGYILASLSQERQWTQRRGRMLRKAEGKDKAVLHDFMVLPPSNVEFKYQKKLVEREFERIKEFAELSMNYYDEGGTFSLMQELNENYLTKN